MKTTARTLLTILVAIQAAAYDHPLRSSAFREAYFMGSGGRYTEFLSAYTKNLPVPKTGPHVAQVEVRTPFAHVVVSSHESVGYSAEQAAQDYRKNPDTVQVRVQILNTATFSILQLADLPRSVTGDARWEELRQEACGGVLLRMRSLNTASEIFTSGSARRRTSNQNRPTGCQSFWRRFDTGGRGRLVRIQNGGCRFGTIARYGYHT
ncbi:MAG: hypothetical protein DMG30_08035 [Acidobacteria bacterium]|nr:MAG: hypothetical protein DMG30_08035 [Acidobacteriota bacterium]